MKTFYIDSIGCALRNLDSIKVEKYFIANGWELTNDFLEADIVIYVSCGVVKNNENTSFKFLEKALASQKKTMLLGCVSVQAPQRMSTYNDCKNLIVLPTYDLNKIDLFFPEFNVKFQNIENPHFIKDRHTLENVYKKAYLITKRSFVKMFSFKVGFLNFFIDLMPYMMKRKRIPIIVISSGCNQQCTYCSIRKAVGPHISKSLNDIKNEFEELIKSGNRIIALDADDTGGYGMDIGLDFSVLLDELYKIEGADKIHLMIDELNPFWLIKNLDNIKKYVKNGFIYRMLVPVQSGSSNVLKSMKRFSDINTIVDSINSLKDANKRFTCCTHIMVNYTTETDSDFEQSLNVLEKLKVDRVLFLFYHLNDNENISNEEIHQFRISQIQMTMKKLPISYDIHI